MNKRAVRSGCQAKAREVCGSDAGLETLVGRYCPI